MAGRQVRVRCRRCGEWHTFSEDDLFGATEADEVTVKLHDGPPGAYEVGIRRPPPDLR